MNSTTAASAQPEARAFLGTRGWTKGLMNALISSVDQTPIKFFICDDSTSMESEDGKHFIGEGNTKRLVRCTRWEELRETILFHAKLSCLLSTETEFRLLNGAAPIVLGTTNEEDATNLPIFEALLNHSPSGGTPLCFHMIEIIKQITELAPMLRAKNKKAAIIIATDGEPSDGDIAEAMRPLRNLPCYLVIRLCTDQESVIQYWDGLIKQLELYMDVIDDPIEEATEVCESNDWFTYAEPLHRLREFGVPVKEYYAVDYKKFNHDQMKAMCCLIFGQQMSEIPHPVNQWKHFLFKIAELNDAEGNVWDPISKESVKWIDMRKLIAAYTPSNPQNLEPSLPSSASSGPFSNANSGAFSAPSIPPPPPPPPSSSQAAASSSASGTPAAPTATIYDAVFPHNGPLGLTLLAHRLTYTTNSGESRSMACAIVQSSKYSTQIIAGDALLAVNNTPLVYSGSAVMQSENNLASYFDTATGTIGSATAPKTLKLFRLLRQPIGGTPVTTPISLEEATAIGIAVQQAI